MEAHLCLPTRHFAAMRHHKTVLVHSSVRLPALQAKVGPPPGAARVPVVGAGVVLSCALGAMYWKRARALQLPIHCSKQPSHGGNGSSGDDPESGIVSIEALHDLLSKICIRELDPKPTQLTKLIHECLAQKDLNLDFITSLLEGNFPKTIGDHEYNLGMVLIVALISEKKYAKAKEICNQLFPIPSDSDAKENFNQPPDLLITIPSDSDARPPDLLIAKDVRPNLLLAIINVMMAMESMLQFPNETSKLDLKEKLEQVEKSWEHYKNNVEFQKAPPMID